MTRASTTKTNKVGFGSTDPYPNRF